MQFLKHVTLFAVIFCSIPASFAIETSAPAVMQFGADRTSVKRKENIVELRGNAYVFRDNETIRADEIDLDRTKDFVVARGRVQYRFDSYSIIADEIAVDLNLHTGVITNGNLSNGKFSLRGSRMEQIGPDHYLIKDYDYTTCHDCPNSWELAGKDVDFTIEGYAFIKDFVFKVKDTSLFWLPFMVVPIKTKRQSGVLFPRFGVAQVYGTYVVQPYFWAINDWSDMTFGVGNYSLRGARFEWEGRWALTNESFGQANFYWTKDDSFRDLKSRFAIKLEGTQQLPLGFQAKLRAREVSDSAYPITYSDDVVGRAEPVLSSDLFFSRNDPEISTVLSFRRIRNLLYFDTSDSRDIKNGFDPGTVQELPRLVLNTNNKFIFGQTLAAGMELRLNRFSRAAGPFDFINIGEGTDQTQVATIREANRLTLIPNLYTTFNPIPWLSVTPSVQYRSFFYNFNGVQPNLARAYLLAQAEMSFQLERTFQGSEGTSYKHIIRPRFNYSNIPLVQESSKHPFVEQVVNQARPGQYFDSSDIVPIRSSQNLDSYFTPLANSLTYGLTTQIFKKTHSEGQDVKVERRFEASVYQTLDIKEANRKLAVDEADSRIILSPLTTQFIFSDGQFSTTVNYTYYSFLDRYLNAQLIPFANPHRVSTSVGWTLDQKIKDGLLRFERSFWLNYTFSKLTSRVSSLQGNASFSINDYVMPRVALSYNLVPRNYARLETFYGALFQSPSRCWQFDLGITESIDRGTSFLFEFSLNFTGNSFGTVDDKL